MPVGSKYKIWVPIELGYYNMPGQRLNNTPLVFEIELLEIVKTP
jgi:FKBP-type peptidyl-prolyl cis-trans isomerase